MPVVSIRIRKNLIKMPKIKETKTLKFTHAVGRRRESVARVRLFAGKGETLVNNMPIDKYFPGEIAKKIYLKPFEAVEGLDKYFATILTSGGGKEGQLGALVHGLSRAFNTLDREKFRPVLKSLGLLTRDPRTRERRMIGMGGKSRRKKQSPKR